MHEQAREWVQQRADLHAASVLDIGGRNLNGSVRSLFVDAEVYTSIDLYEGPGVDIVADAADWTPDRLYDCVVSCEVFEHAERWHDICVTAYRALRAGGTFVATMAGPDRGAHSGIDGFALREGEYYENVEPGDLHDVLMACGFTQVLVDRRTAPADVRCWAVK